MKAKIMTDGGSGQGGREEREEAESACWPKAAQADWAESEFFRVWLRLAREGQERNRG